MRTGRRLLGMWTLLLRDPDMSGSAAFLCRKVQSRGKISQEQNKCGHIFVKRSQCLWRLVSVSGTGLYYLETERGWKKYPPSCTVSHFTVFCRLSPHLHRKGQDSAQQCIVLLALTLACTGARHTWEARTQARSDVTSQSNGHELTVSCALCGASLPLPSFRRVTRCGPRSVLAGNTHMVCA